MRIALVSPTYWPEVRRGSERVVHDLGSELAGRGHDVTVITSHRRRPTVTVEEGMKVIRSWRPGELPGTALHEYHLLNVPTVFGRLVRGSFDLAHSFFPADSWAAVLARRFGGPPVIATMHGVPTREYLVARRYRLEMIHATVRRAEACTVLSEAAARPYRRYLFREPTVLPAGVVGSEYATDEPRSESPTLFCASSLGDPRKRAPLLFAALGRLRERRPEITLRVARPRDPVMSDRAPELPDGAEWVDVDAQGALAAQYASAWVTVNPAVGEAFGLVLLESLAAGTPIVADDSGAAPEIVGEREIGRVFSAEDETDLTRALHEALDLAQHEPTAAECRARAADYDWSRVVERYEAVYRSVLAD